MAHRLSWKYIGSEVIGGWTHAFTKRNARLVFGVVVWLWRLLSIIGTQPRNNIDSRHSVTVQNRVVFIRQARQERFKAGRVWYGKKKTGLTRTLFLIEGWMTYRMWFGEGDLGLFFEMANPKKRVKK
jgi:hypothetical protein